MAKDSDKLAGSFETENTGGLIAGFLAEEDEFDRRTLWRLGSWAAASVGAVVIALFANQTSVGMRREQIASVDLARQSQQIQSVAKESQSEARRLASAIETLNSDRDRLYSRVAVLEQGLDSVTGAIARQNSTPTSPQATSSAPSGAAAAAEPSATAQKSSPAPAVSPVAATTATTTTEKPAAAATAAEPGPAPVSPAAQAASNAPVTTPTTSLIATKSMMAPPDPAAGKLIEPSPPPKTVTAAPIPEVVASAPAAEEVTEADTAAAAPKLAVQRTEFGVDVGGANSLPGLRALWHGLLKSRSNAPLTKLRPIIVIKEGSNGLGMQLRLVAGPIDDAAAAAKICAVMIENDRPCVTTVFEGQRLAVNADEPAAAAYAKPAPTDAKPAAAPKPILHGHYVPRRGAKDESAQKPEPSTLSLIFGRR